MKTSREIIDGIGRQEIVKAIGVDIRRVNRAAYEDRLPALWYDALCNLAGEDLPRESFTFKRAGAA